MSSIQVIAPASDPGTYQVWAIDVDASVAVIHGTVQSSLWLTELDARSLHRALGEKLGDTPAVHRIQPDSTFTREPTCWSWCAGASEPHPSDERYREHSSVALTLSPHLRVRPARSRRPSTSISRSLAASRSSASPSVRTSSSTSG